MNYKLKTVFSKDPDIALEEILRDRGVTDIENFMYPTQECELNPLLLDNIEKAANCLLDHLDKSHNILLAVDCDVDGISSAAILWLYIKKIYPNANLHFIMHEHKQHGLNDIIDWIEQQVFNLVLVPDAGSYDVEEHNRLDQLGIDCIVLDHHAQLLDNDGNPIISTAKNTIIVNNQLSNWYENKALCGAGIVYKFCEVLDNILGTVYASDFLDLVALGEIADVMNRCDIETNYLMIDGLQHIQNKGFRTLIESQSFSLKEKATPPYVGLTPIDIAFYIAPLINALMRVGTMEEKETLFYCFIDSDKIVPSTKRGAKPGDTETAAEQTARVGKNAKARQDKLKEKAIEIIDFKIQKNGLDENNVIIVEIEPQDKIPQEISGLIAMAIVSKYNKPCLILRRNNENLLQGSARTNNNFSELAQFKSYLENSGFFEYAAGHEGAFGAGIQADQVDAFLNYVNKTLPEDAFENYYIVDYILDAHENNNELMYALAAHPEFFGNHIDEIKIVIENIELDKITIMGANKDSIKINYNNIDYVRFKDNDFIDQTSFYKDNATLTVYGRININNWMGHKSLQCFINDYEFKEKCDDKYAF